MTDAPAHTPLPEPVAWAVKPLVWHKSHMPSWNEDWHTIGPFTYTIRCADENGWKWTHGGGFGYAPTPDGCKAFAQADYECRIRSALEPVKSRDLAKIVYRVAFGCDTAELTEKADGTPYGDWAKALKTADAILEALIAKEG